jgi:CBS-domain-containing membrane protein
VALSLATTAALMIVLNVPHPPAAGTALVVGLGVVSKPEYLLVLKAGVALLVVQAIVINRLTGVRYPLWAGVPTPKIGALASHGGLQRFTRLPGPDLRQGTEHRP